MKGKSFYKILGLDSHENLKQMLEPKHKEKIKKIKKNMVEENLL